MKIDKRIIDGARPFTQYDTDKAKQYLNKECYFSDYMNYFVDVERYCSRGRLDDINDNGEFPFKIAGHDLVYAFCLPCELVKVKQPATTKFVPYTLDTWEQEFKTGDVIIFRGKVGTERAGRQYKCIYAGWRLVSSDITKDPIVTIALGLWGYTFSELFDLYEIYRGGNWEPFGRKVENIDICAGS